VERHLIDGDLAAVKSPIETPSSRRMSSWTLMWWEEFDAYGQQFFSLIIPKQINLIRTAAWHSETETETGYLTPGDTQVRIAEG
nr:RNA polymerase II large subunit [Tanacetum cinerariifolium]